MNKAFTMIELLIVLGVIALLTSIVIKVSVDGVIHSRALQVAMNITEIMKAAQYKTITSKATTDSLEELDISLRDPANYGIDMAYFSVDASVAATVTYSGIVDKERIKGILQPDAVIVADMVSYCKKFPVYW
jgi:prepilin-type N-terminal cleavage/methylation domain-containing protein